MPISVRFGGDGLPSVSRTMIREHQGRPEELAARNMRDALKLTGWSWFGEDVAIITDAKSDEEQERYREQLRFALDEKVKRDMNRSPKA